MKKKIVISASMAMVVLLGLTVAVGAHWHGNRSMEHRIDYIKYRLAKALDLNADQTAAMDRMAADLLAEHDQLEARREEFRGHLSELLNRESITSDDVTRLFEEKRPQFEHMMQLASREIAEFHGLLTPEQRTRLIAEIENLHRGCRFGREGE